LTHAGALIVSGWTKTLIFIVLAPFIGRCILGVVDLGWTGGAAVVMNGWGATRTAHHRRREMWRQDVRCERRTSIPFYSRS